MFNIGTEKIVELAVLVKEIERTNRKFLEDLFRLEDVEGLSQEKIHERTNQHFWFVVDCFNVNH